METPKESHLSIEQISMRLPEEFRAKLISEFQTRSANNKKLRIYSDGCFDLFHYAHARQFEQLKNMFPNVELIIGVCSDADVLANKGLFVLKEDERIEAIRHCKWTDEIIGQCPWVPAIEFIDKHNIDFIAHDAIPYKTPDCADCYLPFKEAGRFIPTMRTEGVSTSDLIMRVLKHKDEYYDRNFKKGNTRNDMNMGVFDYGLYQFRKLGEVLKKDFQIEKNEKK